MDFNGENEGCTTKHDSGDDQFQKKIDKMQQELHQLQKTSSAQIQDLRDENELLLLQLHQVQEELERYFLAYQTMEASLEASRKIMDRACTILGKRVVEALNGK